MSAHYSYKNYVHIGQFYTFTSNANIRCQHSKCVLFTMWSLYQVQVCVTFTFFFFLLFFSKPNYKILNLHFILIVTVSHDGWGSRNAGFGNKNMYREQCREGRTLVLLLPPFFVFPLLFDFSSSNVHSCLNNFGPSKWNDSQSSTN